MPKLTAAFVRSVEKPGRHSDGQGLYLNVTKSGAKSWVMMWKRDGRVREMGLGSATGEGKIGALALADARQAATVARQQIAADIDPIAEKRRKKVKSFGQCADSLIESLRPGWKNEKHAAQWEMTMKVYAAPLRERSVHEIATEDVLRVLKPIWQGKPETASRVRGRIEKVLDFAKARGMREGENPARWKGNLDHLLSRPVKLLRGHHEAMAYPEVPAFMAKLRDQPGTGALALQFAILTACRSGEVLGAEWSEIDFEAGLWTIPAARMKAGREHVVPLTSEAVSILRQMAEVSSIGFVFGGAKPGKPLSSMAMAMTLRRMKVDVTPHGFRSSFRDFAGNETNAPREIAEEALAHTVGDAVERAYRRGAAIVRRRALMETWASFLSAPAGGNVRLLKAKEVAA
ncbi:MAG: integrase arm-type DNA-binding domain-containing protein [Aurantimonas endophytica]|uniref:tyrosine-type recombinase/integrase n=1 Tax=Aurantimonas endophytica TaxID=1522175 RepID=UPI003001B19C